MNLTFMIFEVSKQLPRSKNLTMAINKLHYGHMTRDTMFGMMTSDVPDNLWSHLLPTASKDTGIY